MRLWGTSNDLNTLHRLVYVIYLLLAACQPCSVQLTDSAGTGHDISTTLAYLGISRTRCCTSTSNPSRGASRNISESSPRVHDSDDQWDYGCAWTCHSDPRSTRDQVAQPTFPYPSASARLIAIACGNRTWVSGRRSSPQH
ncbi:hypothetical protein BU26DRAFT_120594 [Trematosphaeria pertusa]|uniref:Secreted protein n=1 Tax=Trematosphaeria pertusa TaxID=390896 RepID=A0A6A6HYV2_9PLEO|nr:uncharacterized protein BU26DRAFT_120594 [Trematosphaeria pertusa]KAF2242882.1 hypothetical protein BU26DRAFT_120594 [Trematosphaeria pertusa]